MPGSQSQQGESLARGKARTQNGGDTEVDEELPSAGEFDDDEPEDVLAKVESSKGSAAGPSKKNLPTGNTGTQEDAESGSILVRKTNQVCQHLCYRVLTDHNS
jgi:hypothetical protein